MTTQKDLPKILIDFGGVIVKNGFWNWVDLITSNPAEKAKFGALIDKADKGDITEEECFQQLAILSHRTPEEVKQQLFAEFTLKEGVVEIMNGLRAEGYSLILVTNFMQVMVNGLLDHHRLRPFFEKIFISSQMGLSKPSPEFFQEVIRELKITPKQAVFIDDSDRNIEASVKEGIERSWLFKDEEELKSKLQEGGMLPEDFQFEHVRRMPLK